MKKIVKIIVFVLFAGTIVFFGLSYYKQKQTKKHGCIKVSGNIEATDIRLSFRVNGQIEELLVDEGMMVKKGDIVARLNKDELIKIKNEAEASLKASEFVYERARDDYFRMENLFKAGSIPEQKRDSYKTNTDSAKANVDALKASLELAVTRLGFTDLVCPINGFILVKSAEQGEVIQPGSAVFTVVDLNDIWLTAYINETELGRIKLNQECYIKIDTYRDKKYNGRISFISQEAEFTPKHIQTNEERVKLVYRIKIKINNDNLELKPGMPADGYIIE